MLRRLVPLVLLVGLTPLRAQPDLWLSITSPGKRLPIAVPDFSGDSRSQPLMAAFNEVVWRDLDDSGVLALVSKSRYPSLIPRQPADFAGTISLQQWSTPPIEAAYLAIGYSALQGDSLVVRGWLLDDHAHSIANAQLFEKRYGESANEAGARRAGHQFAADILSFFGIPSSFGSHIYFERESSPAPNRRTEIWMMDADGGNQRQITHLNSTSIQPAVSPDGQTLAFVTYARVFPGVARFSLELMRELPFANLHEPASVTSPSFTPDGQHILYSVRFGGVCCQIMMTDLDGRNAHALTASDSINPGAAVNPKTGAQVAFISGRAGHPQLYLMDIDGTAAERISDSSGEVASPSWNPSGKFLAYAGTRGYASTGWNIFVIPLGKGEAYHATDDQGWNEHPSWSPDGLHLVFSSRRSGSSQIWSMLADGTHLRQLTDHGSNLWPVWGK